MTTNINADNPVYIVGVKRFWRPSWQQFFGHLSPRFVKAPGQVPQGATALIWGVKTPASAFATDVTLYRVEDGFIRSVGLGAEFTRPLSWVVDGRGMYFDASQPSDLEQLLQHDDISEPLQQRAQQLIAQLLASGVSKYNTGLQHWQPPALATQQRIILVPGQVEADASIQFGSPMIKHNIELLKQVRANCPEDYIIYKPHPDVVAGARRQGNNEAQAQDYCDQLVTDISIDAMLPHVDAVHTMTSLTGFEALIRDKEVHCYGQPFYSGWGLTTDYYPNSRRTRQRSLAELVAASLIMYPRYVLPKQIAHTSSEAVGPEDIIECIRQQRSTGSMPISSRVKSLLKKRVRQLVNRWQ